VKFLLVFFGLFTPLACMLWYLAGDTPEGISLVSVERSGDTKPVLKSRDIPFAPVEGRLTRFQNGRVQRFDAEDDHVSYWVHVDGIGRDGGQPRLEGIRCALFGKPKDGSPNLRLTFNAPYLEGDPMALLEARRGMARVLVLGGGVVVSDERGRTIAKLDSVLIDIDKEELSSDAAVLVRSPERGAQLRGRGFVADLRSRTIHSATLLHDVSAQIPLGKDGGEMARISCEGPATLVREAGTDNIVVTLKRRAHIEHAAARGDCDRITAYLHVTRKAGADGKEERTVELDRLEIEGAVDFELDPASAYQLEKFSAASITIHGRREIVMRGGEQPVRAVRRGPLKMFGLADRVLDIETPEIRILLLPAGPDGKLPDKPLDSIEFPRGLVVIDRNGSGRIEAGRVTISARAGRLEADGGVEASMPGRKLSAQRIDVRRVKQPRDVVLLAVYGKKRFDIRPTGRLGPLSRAGVARLVFSSDEVLYLESLDKRTAIRTAGNVVVTGDGRQLFRCDSIEAAIDEKNSVQSFDAKGNVEGTDPGTRAELRANRLRFDAARGNEITLDGKPASVSTPDGRSVKASTLRYREDRSFAASGDVDAHVIVAEGKAAGAWRFRCATVRGKVSKERSAEDFFAEGAVRAEGPGGKRLEADSVTFTKATGTLTLRGNPARLRQGEEISYEGAGLDIKFDTPDPRKPGRFELLRAAAAGETYLLVRPKAPPENKKNRIALWKILLRGPAQFDGKHLLVPGGARIIGYDARGKLSLDGEAADLGLEIERSATGYIPKVLRGRKKIELVTYKDGRRNATVRSATLDYVVGSRKIDMGGGCEVLRPGKEAPVRFREVELEVREAGVNLKYLAPVER